MSGAVAQQRKSAGSRIEPGPYLAAQDRLLTNSKTLLSYTYKELTDSVRARSRVQITLFVFVINRLGSSVAPATKYNLHS
jgi:hypothetical protein